ncbi:MAG: alpha/beta hydrolase [Pseudomonadota bacterium]
MSDKTSPKSEFTRPLAHLNGERPPAPAWFESAIAAPSEEGSTEVDGCSVRYSAWGEKGAPGLLFVHGGRAHRNWWRPFAPYFAGDHRVAALDLSGMGDSGWRERYSLENWVREIFSVIEAAELDRAGRPVVIGHSFGGWITLGAVEEAGERLGGAVVLDSPLGVPDPHEGYQVARSGDNNGDKENGANAEGDSKKKKAFSAKLYETQEEPVSRFRLLPDQPGEHLYILDYIAREGLKRVEDETGKEGWRWKFDAMPGGDIDIHFERELLRVARCPLAFVYGEKSAFAAGDALAHIEAQAKGRSPFIMMPECHHHLMLDQPLAFIATLRTLLACWPVRVGA